MLHQVDLQSSRASSYHLIDMPDIVLPAVEHILHFSPSSRLILHAPLLDPRQHILRIRDDGIHIHCRIQWLLMALCEGALTVLWRRALLGTGGRGWEEWDGGWGVAWAACS